MAEAELLEEAIVAVDDFAEVVGVFEGNCDVARVKREHLLHKLIPPPIIPPNLNPRFENILRQLIEKKRVFRVKDHCLKHGLHLKRLDMLLRNRANPIKRLIELGRPLKNFAEIIL